MAVNTILIDFSVDPKQAQAAETLGKVEASLRDFIPNLKLLLADTGCGLRVFSGERGCVVALRTFPTGLITLNIDYYREENQEPLLTAERSRDLKRAIANSLLGRAKSQSFPPIKRGVFMRYYPTSDDRLLEYDIDQMVFDENSPFQKVQIVHSKSLGNMLVLDDLQNISEADLIYTETLMQRGKEDYKGKEILVLGGGDGALLYELLKEAPQFVTMIEIDEVVMRACNEHMRSICGDVLDKRSGPNYQIIVDDCLKYLDQYAKEGRQFDYVFGDLTDIPIAEKGTTGCGEVWSFIMQIAQKSLAVLRPTGKYMLHGNGSSCMEALKVFEQQLAQLEPPLAVDRAKAYVPSFMEDWIFYQIGFKA